MTSRAQSLSRRCLPFAFAAVVACRARVDEPDGRSPSGLTLAASVAGDPVRAPVVAERGLEISFEIRPDVVLDRVPMQRVVLHFRNASSEPLRVYIPLAAPFRAGISSLYFRAHDQLFVEPEPQPHGYVVTEADFPLLAPGEEKTFDQAFTVDPMGASRPDRRRGFEPGAAVRVTWVYENGITRWAGGARTLDGVTRALFDGGVIPHVWTGRLSTEATWVVR